MLPVRRLFALHAVLGVMAAAASARPATCAPGQEGHGATARSGPGAGALGEMPLPGGLRAALAAVDDRAAADRSQFLLDLIRRSYDTPIRVKTDPREPPLRALLARLDPSSLQTDAPFDATARPGPSLAQPRDGKAAGDSAAPETVPLPLPAAIWIDAVFRGRATPQSLAGAIIRSRNASLLYYGLLSLDDATRAWFATQPDFVAEVAERYPAAFAAAAPGLRIANGALRVPGGDDAEPAWKAIVGRQSAEPAEFMRSLLMQGDGRMAYFFGALAQLTPAQIRFALNLDSRDAADQALAARRLYESFASLGPGWNIEERAFWRPGLDPILLAAELSLDPAGRPFVPGTRRFWTAVFAEGGRAGAVQEDTRALAEGDPVDMAWLSEQVFRGAPPGQRRRYQLVLFASRTIPRITSETARDALEAVRAAGDYPALVATLERAKLSDVAVFAAAARRAAGLSAIDDNERMFRALAQFQGAIAVITQAALRGSLPAGELSAAVRSLSEVDFSNHGDYEGRLVRWLAGLMDSRRGATPEGAMQLAPAAGAGATADDDTAGGLDLAYENAPGALDRKVLLLLSGPAVTEPRFVEWEGTRYRLDLSLSEARRLTRRLGEHPLPYLSSAQALVAMADALAEPGLTRETLRRQAGVLGEVAQALDWDGPAPPGEFSNRYREIASALGRPNGDGDVRRAPRLAPSLRLLADELLARGLMELTYAVALGQPERAVLYAGDAARRHDFWVRSEALGRAGPWQLPLAGAEGASGRGWRVMGSVLGLDVRLADFSLMRLSSRLPPITPTLHDVNRRVLTEAVALVEPASLTEAGRDTLVMATRKGRARLAALRTPAEAAALADDIRLGAARRTLLAWTVEYEPARVAAFLSPSELFWLGLGATPLDSSLHAWGAPGEPRLGCLCLRLIDPRPIELLSGRWNFGMLASAFPDLNLRLAEVLADMKMPAALLGPVLASATLDFINSVTSRDQDDRRALVEFLQALRPERVEQYLALLTTDGPLVPVGEAADPPPPARAGSKTGVSR